MNQHPDSLAVELRSEEPDREEPISSTSTCGLRPTSASPPPPRSQYKTASEANEKAVKSLCARDVFAALGRQVTTATQRFLSARAIEIYLAMKDTQVSLQLLWRYQKRDALITSICNKAYSGGQCDHVQTLGPNRQAINLTTGRQAEANEVY